MRAGLYTLRFLGEMVIRRSPAKSANTPTTLGGSLHRGARRRRVGRARMGPRPGRKRPRRQLDLDRYPAQGNVNCHTPLEKVATYSVDPEGSRVMASK